MADVSLLISCTTTKKWPNLFFSVLGEHFCCSINVSSNKCLFGKCAISPFMQRSLLLSTRVGSSDNCLDVLKVSTVFLSGLWELPLLFSASAYLVQYNSASLFASSLFGADEQKEQRPSSFASYIGDETSHRSGGSSRTGSGSGKPPAPPSSSPHVDSFTDAMVEATKVSASNGSGTNSATRASNGSGANRFRYGQNSSMKQSDREWWFDITG